MNFEDYQIKQLEILSLNMSVLSLNDEQRIKEIDKAYRKKALLYHPDKNSGLEDKFKEANHAHDFLIASKSEQNAIFTTDPLSKEQAPKPKASPPTSSAQETSYYSHNNKKPTENKAKPSHKEDIKKENCLIYVKNREFK